MRRLSSGHPSQPALTVCKHSAKTKRDQTATQRIPSELPQWGEAAACCVQAGYKDVETAYLCPGCRGISLPNLTYNYYFLCTWTYKRLKSTILYWKANVKNMHTFSSVQMCLYVEQLSSITKFKKINIASTYRAYG